MLSFARVRVGRESANVSGTAGFAGESQPIGPSRKRRPTPFFSSFFRFQFQDEIMELSTCWRGKREEVGGQ